MATTNRYAFLANTIKLFHNFNRFCGKSSFKNVKNRT